jgi:predicted tellurium resistance membrane protein TerC
MELLNDPVFWLAVGQIILIDILLGGDNAIVIAMACRGLPEHHGVVTRVEDPGLGVNCRCV